MVLLKTSCKKNDVASYEEKNYNPKVIEGKFFQLNAPISKESKSVYNYLYNINQQAPFAVETAKKIGYPLWNKVLHKISKAKNIAGRDNLGGSSGDTLISIIPFVKVNDTVVNDVLIVKSIDADTLHYFVCDWQYSQYNNVPQSGYDPAEKFSFFFLAVNKEVFGYDIFTVTDSSLFSTNGENSEIIKIIDNAGTSNLQEIEECYEVEVVTSVCSQASNIRVGQYNCYVITATYEYCVTIPGGGGPTGGGPTGGGGGGPTGGGSTTPPECPNNNFNSNCPTGWNTLPNSIVLLRNIYLNANAPLTNDQLVWLNYNRARAVELFNYFEENGVTAQSTVIGRQHLEFMIGEASYLAFVEDHKLTGNPNIMWWSDINWLRQINFQFPNEDIFNLWNEAAKPENPKPYAEFENICDGINYIMNQSINDPQKNERTGYITVDNKFIFTTIGRGDVTNINVKMLGEQAYYTYKINKGAPQLNYFGRLERNGEYWIPIKTSIHNHILVSCQFDNVV